MNAANANSEIKDVVRDLLSRNPVKFNSAINTHFASGCSYQGRGLKISGASQLKHAAYLLNVLDFGASAKVDDQDIHWDDASSTAVVKATRNVRPAFFPLIQFAVPTKVVLKFNAEEDAKETLFCTQWKDEWPLEQILQKLPAISYLYSSFLIPALTVVFVWASSLAFWLHAKVEAIENRYAKDFNDVYRQRVEPRLPPSLVQAFDAGVHAAEHIGQHGVDFVSRVSYGPLKLVEELARTVTVLANVVLPLQLQLPYPSVFNEYARAAPAKAEQAKQEEKQPEKKPEQKPKESKPESVRAGNTGSQSPQKKVSGSLYDQNPSNFDEETISEDLEKKRKAEASPMNEETRHAKVVVGPSEDGTHAQAKEIDVVTHQVTEKSTSGESAKESLYQQLKKADELPSRGGDAKRGSGKKKTKNGKK